MDPAVLILLGSFLFMLFIRIPIAFSLGLSTMFTAFYVGLPPMVVMQQMVKGINSFSLMAIPFFIIAGEIMGQGGISDRLIKFSNVIIGWMRGGLAMVNILASMFFGGISGSSVADVSSIGSIMIPMMEKKGFDKDYSINVTITSSVQGIIIPPSHNMIIYSLAAGGGISVAKLFLGGIVPGVLLGIALMILSYAIAVKRDYPREEKVSFKEALRITRDSILGLLTAVIIIGGVTTGVFTATESAAIAAVYAFIITFFVYRDIPISKFVDILRSSLSTLAMVVAIIATSSAFAWMMSYLQVPAMITDALLDLSNNPIIIMLLVNLILLFLGTIMDMAPLILIATPILLPVVRSIGMDPITFGVVMMLNLGVGLLTPPVGSTLFVGCSIGNAPIEKIAKSLMPFYAVLIIMVLLLSFVPALTLWLPNFLMG
ncbi:TRAP transporter large permease [Halanaerobium saccharolyticum]|jgi:tripartite ATP-independent transporter DctM subunit|uniref:Tripartite ATP-independent transporter DctM subunit n=1 Tax=Halanaerobium saccharolyticum TaxID=43595 RepID=A0A2T5RHP5_9FIRM|nr:MULTISPECIES: TRAP transporter large permease [Halanaerobium]PTV96764.1 tripartite ATP-independent transporter DctM subunit [Halanaerobium saccharolyticum]PUU88846.1 MAG: TRAP dicarboxylate transporter subunit DctM [Halanaerobium sp.]TDP90093.1 tripartite ATP-independent transporter DctM subunit [Halanaerobium saccharolyticum]